MSKGYEFSQNYTVPGDGSFSKSDSSTVRLTIPANDKPPPPAKPEISIEAAAATVMEPNSVPFTVKASATSPIEYRVNVEILGGQRFVLESFRMDLASNRPLMWINESEAEFLVHTEDDDVSELWQSVCVKILPDTENPARYTVTRNSNKNTACVQVLDNDGGSSPPAPTIGFAESSSSASENAGVHNVQVNLSSPPSSTALVYYMVSGTATSGTDFTALPGSVSVDPGETDANISVNIIDDNAAESNETVMLTLTHSSDSDYQVAGVHTLTITDNDGATPTPTPTPTPNPTPVVNPAASFASSASSVAEDAGDVKVPVSLNASKASAFTLRYKVAGTATAGEDYDALRGVVVATARARVVNIPVKITDDNAEEDDETVVFTLSASSAYTLGSPGVHTLTITDNDDNITITSAEGEEIPSAFALAQNYPNPFNPSTTIEFSIPRTQHVSLAVYDMLGHEVRTLMDGVQPAANYRISFDASDLPSGAYLYVLRTEEQTAVKKMSLLR